MLERIRCCLCHPKFIGKFHKDKGIKVFLIVLIYFALYLAFFAAATFTAKTFNDDSNIAVTSGIILDGNSNAKFDTDTNKLTGDSNIIKGDGFTVYILPNANQNASSDIGIVLNEDIAHIYFSGFKISSISYESLNVSSFSFNEVCNNNPSDIYIFKIFINDVLNSSNLFFQSVTFIEGVINALFYFMIILLCSYIFSNFLNPTIDRGIRIKLCLYDSVSFFGFSIFAVLFDAGWLVYLAASIPVIFTIITFKHIVKVVVRR